NYWMHNGYMNIDNEKMSKSLGNFILTKVLIANNDPMRLRFFMLSVDYRNRITFQNIYLQRPANSFDRIKTAHANVKHRKSTSADLGTDEHIWLEKIKGHEQAFQAAMDDDFNTANAITVLFDLAKEANVYLEQNQTNTAVLDAYAT